MPAQVRINKLLAEDLAACCAQEELFAGLNCQPGFVCSRSELSQDLRSLLQSGLFANVDARVAHKGKGKYTLNFTFSENLWQPIKSFQVRAPAGSSSLHPALCWRAASSLACSSPYC